METLNSLCTQAMMDLMTRRLPFSEPLPGMCSSMVQVPMTMY